MLNQDIAKALVTDENFIDKLLYVENVDTFFLYDGRFYQRLPYKKLEKLIHSYIVNSFPNTNITMHLISDIAKQSGLMCYNTIEELASPYIALRDKLLNTDTFEFEDFDRNKIALSFIDISTDDILHQPAPNWENFLQTALVKDKELTPDKELISLAQEMFGYYLSNSMLKPAVFFLVGTGGNGKSTMQNVLHKIIGKDNCTHMSIETLTTNQWAIAELVGIKLNICGEEESKHLRVDKFKELVTGEPTQGDRKYQSSIKFQPQTKYIFASNQMPSFEGVSPAIKRRIMILPFFNHSLANNPDINLPAKLDKEMAGIMRWAIQGGKRWIQNEQRFSTTKATTEALKEFTEESSSAVKFFNEKYVVDGSKRNWIPKTDLYSKYILWCNENGRKPMNSSNFVKHILLEYRDIEERIVRIENKPQRSFHVNEVIELMTSEDLVVDVQPTIDDLKDLLSPPF